MERLARLAAGLALLTAWPSGGLAAARLPAPIIGDTAGARPVAVFGADDRRAPAAGERPLASRIGRLLDNVTNSGCTAFCLAGDAIMTAAHCVLPAGHAGGDLLPDLWFSLEGPDGKRLSRIAGFADGTALANVMTGAPRASVHRPADASHDWAVLRLAQPACPSEGLTLRPTPPQELRALAAGGRLAFAGYHGDRPGRGLAVETACPLGPASRRLDKALLRRDFLGAGDLVLHRCDTGEGASGAPLLVTGAAGPAVVGLNVGSYGQGRRLARHGRPTLTEPARPVANTAIGLADLAPLVAAFLAATPANTAEDVREAQELLARLNLLAGPTDGRLGEATRSAIRAFQRRAGLAATGMPSRELLELLSRQAPAATTSRLGTP